MGSLTNTAEQEMLDHICNQLSYASPTTVYLGLCTADPTDAATGASANECANTNNYGRVALSFGAAATRQIANDALATFNQASGAWGSCGYWAVFTSGTYGAGDCLAHGAFTTPKSPVDGDTPSVGIGEIVIQIASGGISNFGAHAILNHLFDNNSFAATVDLYACLATAVLSDSTTGTTISESATGGYARKLVNENGGASPAWDLAVGGDPSYVDNGAEISWGQASADYDATVVANALADALTNGNIWFYDNAVADKTVSNGDTPKCPAAGWRNEIT